MNVQIGSGRVRLAGFTNVDIRRLPETDVLGHAGDLRNLADGSVATLFSHALFEHVFLRHQPAVLAEWRRVLAPEGRVVCLGVPDFEAVARLYLDRAPGVVGERFDLFNAYRYTHGEPEHATSAPWADWKPDREADAAPAGWVPQLHKGLYDANYLSALLGGAGFAPAVFRYKFPGEAHALNLGVIATRDDGPPPPAHRQGIVGALAAVAEIGRFVEPGSVEASGSEPLPEAMLAYASGGPAAWPRPSLASKVKGRLARALGGEAKP